MQVHDFPGSCFFHEISLVRFDFTKKYYVV